jgi:hypothetical protein
MFQTIQDRQDTLQQQLLADRAKHRAFMTHILQHTGVQLPPVQSAPPPALRAVIIPALQAGPTLPSVGPSPSLLRPVTLDFSSPVVGTISTQSLVPPTPAVTTAAMAVSMTAPAPADPASSLCPSQYQLQLLLQILDPRLTPILSLRLCFCLDRDRMRPRLLLPLLVCRFG